MEKPVISGPEPCGILVCPAVSSSILGYPDRNSGVETESESRIENESRILYFRFDVYIKFF